MPGDDDPGSETLQPSPQDVRSRRFLSLTLCIPALVLGTLGALFVNGLAEVDREEVGNDGSWWWAGLIPLGMAVVGFVLVVGSFFPSRPKTAVRLCTVSTTLSIATLVLVVAPVVVVRML